MREISFGAEFLFGVLFTIVGFFYSAYIGFSETLSKTLTVEFVIFAVVAIVGIVGIVDGVAFGEKLFYKLLELVDRAVKHIGRGKE